MTPEIRGSVARIVFGNLVMTGGVAGRYLPEPDDSGLGWIVLIGLGLLLDFWGVLGLIEAGKASQPKPPSPKNGV
jgi:hypothetical protein